MRPWLLIVAASLIAVPAAAEEDADARFQRAVALYQKGRCDEALPIFEDLAEMSPNARLFVARCLEKAGRLAEAYRQMRKTYTEAAARAVEEPRFDETRRHAADEAEALEARVARVTVLDAAGIEDLEVSVAGREVPPRLFGKARAYMPGSITVRARAPGHEPLEAAIEVEAGEERSFPVVLEPRAPHPEPSPPEAPSTRAPVPAPTADSSGEGYGFLAAGIASTVVMLGGAGMWIGAGLDADAIYEDLQEACGGGPCVTDEARDEIDRGETLDRVATAGIAITAVGAAGSALFYVLHASQDGGEIESALSLRPGGAGWQLRGRF